MEQVQGQQDEFGAGFEFKLSGGERSLRRFVEEYGLAPKLETEEKELLRREAVAFEPWEVKLTEDWQKTKAREDRQIRNFYLGFAPWNWALARRRIETGHKVVGGVIMQTHGRLNVGDVGGMLSRDEEVVGIIDEKFAKHPIWGVLGRVMAI